MIQMKKVVLLNLKLQLIGTLIEKQLKQLVKEVQLKKNNQKKLIKVITTNKISTYEKTEFKCF